MGETKRGFKQFFLFRYNQRSYILQKKAGIFLWILIALITVTALSFIITNILSPHLATRGYIISIVMTITILSLCLVLLRTGNYTTGTIVAILVLAGSLLFQGYTISSGEGKLVYLMFMLIVPVMSILIGNRITLSVSIIAALTAGIIIIIGSGQLFDSRMKGSLLTQFTIVTLAISTFSFLLQKILTDSLNESENRRKEIELRLQQIEEMVQTCRTISSNLKISSGELLSNSTSFADNAQQQAASVEEITSTLEQISATSENSLSMSVKQGEILDNLVSNLKAMFELLEKTGIFMNDAIQYKVQLDTKIKKAKEVIMNALSAMSNAMKSTGEVTEAMKVINDISDKINLLSLNASIEAARAGEHGRGFAVVADEIGKLAEQTQQNSKAIQDIVLSTDKDMEFTQTSLASVNAVQDDVSEIATEFSRIIDNISEINDEDIKLNNSLQHQTDDVTKGANEVSVAMTELRNAILEISNSIIVINNSTQDLASGSEELSSAADNLTGFSEDLQNVLENK